MLIAAIDPDAEAKLDGLNKALVSGSYLKENEGDSGPAFGWASAQASAPGRTVATVRTTAQQAYDVAIKGAGPTIALTTTRWDKRARASQLLAAVGLAGRERSLPARMSGGEQQRIAIARAPINTPALLLADEPTGNLDSATDILDLLARLRAEHHMTILLASHDPQDRRQIRTADPAAARSSTTSPSPRTARHETSSGA